MAGSYNQVGPSDRSFFIDLVVVNQRATRSFNHADAFESVNTGSRPRVALENACIVQQSFDLFQRINDFYQPRIVIEEGAVRDRSESLMELLEFGVCRRCATQGGAAGSAPISH